MDAQNHIIADKYAAVLCASKYTPSSVRVILLHNISVPLYNTESMLFFRYECQGNLSTPADPAKQSMKLKGRRG